MRRPTALPQVHLWSIPDRVLIAATDRISPRIERRLCFGCAGHNQVAVGQSINRTAQLIDQLVRDMDVVQLGNDLPAGMQIASLSQRNEVLGQTTQLLRLGLGGSDFLVTK